MNIVFFGTPAFAVPSLAALGAAGYAPQLVVTQPDRPKGRGRKVTPPPVKSVARQKGYAVSQPESMRDTAWRDRLAGLEPDLFVVIAYGHLLPVPLLALPKWGAVNVHASLLPRYRGAAPIQWAIINGERETGVTTMRLDRGMDTGDILLSRPTPITADDTAATLHDRLADLGARLLTETLSVIEAGTLRPVPQDHGQATYAPMLTKNHGRIDWTRSAARIDCQIRGMTPWPGAFTFHREKRLRIISASPLDTAATAAPGTVQEGFADELRIATGQGVLSIRTIQGASGKVLPVSVFLRGCPLPPGTVLT